MMIEISLFFVLIVALLITCKEAGSGILFFLLFNVDFGPMRARFRVTTTVSNLTEAQKTFFTFYDVKLV